MRALVHPHHRLPARLPRAAASCCAAILLLAGAPGPGSAQTHVSEMTEFQAGDIYFRTHVHFEFSSETARQAVLAPGDGLSGATFRYRPDGSPSWGKLLHERGYNVYMLDNVGCGKALPPPSDDFTLLVERGSYGVHQIAIATIPDLLIAQGAAAGFALISRSMHENGGDSFVLIDPIGPQGSQPMTTLTSAQVLERWNDRENWIWRSWGFGPKYGSLRRGIDVSAETARALVDGFETGQPAYWAALLTPMDLSLEVREPYLLEGLPVLVIRTHGADRDQIERENSLVTWMQERKMRVDRLDLTQDRELRNTSGLPWIGDDSEAVLERILTWREQSRSAARPGR